MNAEQEAKLMQAIELTERVRQRLMKTGNVRAAIEAPMIVAIFLATMEELQKMNTEKEPKQG